MKNSTNFSYFLMLALSMFAWSSIYAQEKSLSGKVIDLDNGDPLPGVNILVKGTTQGTVTDIEGNYDISVPNSESVLIFSSIGYVQQEITVGNQTTINVSMAADIQSLNEVVVVGYGTQQKKEVTSAVASIKAEEFNKGNVNNPAQLLQGKVPGLTISRPGGNPNQAFNIRLRGLSTLGANTQPLIIIDGVIGADLNSVDPNDIASVDVLKDGSAAAIYGTRGSSGVILITTKTGGIGKLQIDYNGYASAEEVGRTVQVMNAEENIAVGGPDFGGNTNWFDEITRTGLSQVHNLSLSGGTEKTTYRISLNYRDVQGVAINTGFNQLNGRINLTQKALNDRLALTVNLASTVRNSQLGFDQAFRYATVYSPTAPVRSDEPEYDKYDGYFQKPLFDYYNPVAILEQNLNDGRIKRNTFNLQGEYEVVKGLKLMSRYSRNNDNDMIGQYYSKKSFWRGMDRNGFAMRRNDEMYNQLFEATATYDNRFGKLNLTALAGYSYQEFFEEGFLSEGGNFLTDEFTYNNISAAKDFKDGRGVSTSYKNNHRLVAGFGRVNFNYDDTYFLSAILRREGSTRFGTGNKWGNFPAVSAGINMGKLAAIPSIDDLKIRVSYGVTGALPESSYLSLLRFGASSRFFLLNGQYVPVYAPISNPNPNLKWETKREFNYGLDFSLLNSRINGSIDYYTRTTNDALVTLPVPVPPNLFPTSILNVGELKNNGLEVALSYFAVRKDDFIWRTGVNFSTYNTEIVSLSAGDIEYGVRDIANLGAPGQNNTPLIRIEEGKPLGQIWGLVYEGISEDGNWIFKDINNDGQIDTDDRAVIGRGLPKGEMGFTNTFNWKNFDLNFFFRGVFGHDLVNTYRAFYEAKSVANSFNVVKTKYFNPDFTGGATFSDLHVEDASFIKLDNITLGYNVKLPDVSSLSNVRVYLSGQNLFYVTNYTGVEPEVRFTYENNVLAPGIDARDTWLRTRTYTFGLNLSF